MIRPRAASITLDQKRPARIQCRIDINLTRSGAEYGLCDEACKCGFAFEGSPASPGEPSVSQQLTFKFFESVTSMTLRPGAVATGLFRRGWNAYFTLSF